MARLLAHWQRFLALYTKEIWQPALLDDTSLRGRFYAMLRVVSITITVFRDTKAASRASALSFSSLLGLGPLVAIAMLVAGMVLDDKDPDLAVNTLNRVIRFIAPQVAEYEAQTSSESGGNANLAVSAIAPNPTLQAGSGPALNRAPAEALPRPSSASAAASDSSESAPSTSLETSPEAEATVERMLSGFISGSRSGTAGAVGALTLILIVILLFKGIEDAFNEIWGLREGRSWLMRIIYYWTILTLGAVLFFASITLLSAGAFVNVFIAKLPFGAEILQLVRWLLPLSSGALVIGMLTLFYRYIPNTQVYWRAAFAGAVIVALLLLANNFLAFIYVRRVVISRSLYGSLGIMPILMFGLYIFWLYVLIGGQISYAVQNARFRSSQAAWGNLSHASREHLLLLVFLTVARRFQDCLPACSASQLSDIIKAPTQITNECLQRLVDMRFLTPIPAAETEPTSDFLYQPARPLNRTTLADFKARFESFGEEAASEEAMQALDPLLPRYIAALRAGRDNALLTTPIDQLV
ncbi:hypothetical protein AXK12_02440 [Cephaloticoccus capnophilus]|uniref:Uncharacterized protein n=1 Tax=Cephaloticoccus capnophilus TaxID=1548208 RepID=A0A139SR56_9BACT|nr:YihY/virulence factor BrkB family protein [Cephaloticoccus capnophilus]KXU37023.1 hypothetical protein AXK12_02440 [Cephaloticoccus capnophilus]